MLAFKLVSTRFSQGLKFLGLPVNLRRRQRVRLSMRARAVAPAPAPPPPPRDSPSLVASR